MKGREIRVSALKKPLTAIGRRVEGEKSNRQCPKNGVRHPIGLFVSFWPTSGRVDWRKLACLLSRSWLGLL